jgi:hypothetical protein
MGEIGVLVKLGKQQEYILQLYSEGLLYMNIPRYFQEIEGDELRGDPFDSVDEVHRGNMSKIALPNGTEFEGNEWDLGIHSKEEEQINIFCMYALRPSAGTFPLDEKNFEFGDYALVVTNVPEFMNRIAAHLKSQRIRSKLGLVEYVDEAYTGEIGRFRKRDRYAFESEWRVVCHDGPGRPRIIRIGSIQDISIVMPSKEVNHWFKSIYPDCD